MIGSEMNLPEFSPDWDRFVLRLKTDSGDDVEVREREMRVVRSEEADSRYETAFVLNIDGAGEVGAELTAEDRNPEKMMRLRLKNDTGLELVSVDFPRLPVRGVTPDHALYLATPWGSRNYDPVGFLREKYDGEAFRRYPADLAMQYTMICGGEDVYYLSAYHLGDETFEARCSVLADDSVCLTNRWFPYIRNGVWESPENGIALLKGDWHAGADLYRDRMQKHFTPANPPGWMREGFHGWMQVGLKDEGRPPKHRFTDIPELYRKAAETGVNVLHVYGWSGRGFDTMYPDYDINPELGSEEELRAAMDEVRSLGGHVVLYTNGRLVDPDSSFYRNGGSQSTVVSEGDSGPVEQYGTSVRFSIACPMSSFYRDHFEAELEKIITRFHAHAVQIDQISCNPSEFCFSEEHGHSKPSNNWIPGVERFLMDLRTMYNHLDPEFFVWVEGVNERFASYYDVNQGHGEATPWNIGLPFPEQFKYTFPDYLITGLSDNIERLCHTFIQGKPFDFDTGSVKDPEFKRLVTELVAVRKAEPAYLLDGIFRDTVGVTVSPDSVAAKVLVRRDGKGVMVNLWNTAGDPTATATISGELVQGSPRVVYPHDAAVTHEDAGFRVSWSGPVASVVASSRGLVPAAGRTVQAAGIDG